MPSAKIAAGTAASAHLRTIGRRGLPWAVALGILLLVVLAGCDRGAGQRLARWTLDAPGAPRRAVVLPAHLDLEKHLLTYRLTTSAVLDPSLVGRDVEFVVAYLPAPVVLRVDGQEARVLGDDSVAGTLGGCMPHRWIVPAAATSGGAPIELELEIEHRWTQSAWIVAAPELVAAGSPAPDVARSRFLNEKGGWFGVVALSQVGMTFLVVYFWDRRRRAYLWFAIQGLTAAYYPAYVLGLPAPFLGWTLANILLAQALAVAPIISVYFTHAFFRLGPPHRAWLVALAAALLSPITVALRDHHFHDLSYASPIVAACVLSAVGYQLVTGVRLLKTYPDRGTVVFFLCCWIALGSSCWVDVLAWVGGPDVLDGGRPACAGLGLFAIFQSMLLGRSHFRSLAESDRLNDQLRGQVRDLESRQREIATLNDELRRQIGRQATDLLVALTQSPGSAGRALTPGEVVEGRYRVVRTLGAGGMGTVYEVERVGDDKRLALKVAQEVRGIALARLAREAQIATRVHHPNVVSVVDADVGVGGYAYLVMELVDGRSLAECFEGRPASWHLEILRQVLEGVRALHAESVIHRDLKPSNILVSGEDDDAPVVKITDFGISRWVEGDTGATRWASIKKEEPTRVQGRAAAAAATVDVVAAHTPTAQERTSQQAETSSSPQLTRTGAITGTPSYVAPELADGSDRLSPAVDVFSFGVVAYRLFAGTPPHGEPPLLLRLAGCPVPAHRPLGSLTVAISSRLARAIDACLAPAPADRPDVAELIDLVELEIRT